MAIEDLAAEKVAIERNLQAYLQMNVFGQTIENLVKMEVNKINMQKRLHEINREIDDYIKGDLPKDE